MMKLLHGAILAVTAMVCTSIAPQGVLAYDKRVAVVNNTPYRMTELYASDTSQSKWTYNMLQDRPIPPRDGTLADIEDGSPNCMYDLKAVFENGQAVVRYGLDACTATSWTIEE